MMMMRRRSRLSLFLALLFVTGCEQCAPQTGVQQLQAELASTCSFQKASVQRATQDPAASTQPSIASLGEGHVVAWVDDREIPAGVYVQRFDAMLASVGEPRRLKTSGTPHRPRLATSDNNVAVLSLHGSGDGQVMSVSILDDEIEGSLAQFDLPGPGTTDMSHTPGLAFHLGRFVVGYARDKALNIVEFELTDDRPAKAIDAGAGGDSGRIENGVDSGTSGDAGPHIPANVRVGKRTVPFGEGISDLGNIDLLSHQRGLFLVADHPEGWSIVIAEVGEGSVTRFSQVLDDRRNPDHRWCCPSLGFTPNDHFAVMWQGPWIGLTQLYFLELDREGQPVGSERSFEGVARDEEDNAIGRAPVFSPSLAQTPSGLIAAFSDNRFANTEILLASFSCGGSR